MNSAIDISRKWNKNFYGNNRNDSSSNNVNHSNNRNNSNNDNSNSSSSENHSNNNRMGSSGSSESHNFIFCTVENDNEKAKDLYLNKLKFEKFYFEKKNDAFLSFLLFDNVKKDRMILIKDMNDLKQVMKSCSTDI